MPRDCRLELRGQENDDGTFNAAIYDDGEQVVDPAFVVIRGEVGDVRMVYNRASEKYGKAPKIQISLDDCFPVSFFLPDGF